MPVFQKCRKINFLNFCNGLVFLGHSKYNFRIRFDNKLPQCELFEAS